MAGVDAVEALLVHAQPSARAPIPSRLTTKRALSGVRVELDYVPPGHQESYHRVHVIIVDGTSLVHVLYTAQSPDPHLEALEMVLDSLHRGEA